MSTQQTEQIKIVGMIHFFGNIVWWWILGTLWVIWYLIAIDDIDPKAKTVIYDIINFNLSFYIYMIIAFMLIIIIIGLPMLIVGSVVWFVVLVIGFIKHLAWERYEYPFSIKMLK